MQIELVILPSVQSCFKISLHTKCTRFCTRKNSIDQKVIVQNDQFAGLRTALSIYKRLPQLRVYVSHSYISKIENGIREPSLAFMAAFSELTGTSLEYLIVGKKEAKDVKQLLEKVIATLCDLEKEL